MCTFDVLVLYVILCNFGVLLRCTLETTEM